MLRSDQDCTTTLKALIMSKNLHLEHIEDLMLMFGTDGIKESFDYIDDLVRTFSANPSGNRNISTKWDGAPAIFAVQTHMMVASL